MDNTQLKHKPLQIQYKQNKKHKETNAWTITVIKLQFEIFLVLPSFPFFALNTIYYNLYIPIQHMKYQAEIHF